MSTRKDALGVEVEVDDLCLSCPRGKYASKPFVGKVTNVSKTGRVTLKSPLKVSIYAYQRGAPEIEKTGSRMVQARDEQGNLIVEDYEGWGGHKYKRPKYVMENYTYMTKDYTVVDHEWRWVKSQGADINLFVLRKGNTDVSNAEDILGFGLIRDGLSLDYETDKPELA
ncbi:hypothetical protein SEA_OLICIOUS_55 [Streptomyces phage Olicious]|uniref:Uncharacterized protein n=6 Tax=Immanueltrevirus immanuel3 TaxID=2846399 RepID=A0A2H5BMP7_9CAUD|nr:hypothetical protein HWB41_gp44 [Streptomyces phage Immanuel3]AUG87359.1 hypothetical protein SEA_HAUGEANATOR_55 [Streptomyces phage HaugeAnator]AUG87488.1 hypothetical protein SEA_ROMERO_55 [Streptomyces phage Romero]AUG87551.1 hypothetical protein SEA_TORITOKI_55 [Streptomyces phage ToriToki]AUG87616.1 hypothetical protein SEA_ZOOBEAR_55 [Streptomyces phage ZooBear]AZF95843.1 hypothetical protein SEA_OLICIOUS_55 [Streptomyces phage Olicious]UVK59128.1 hypothetical protein SEA_JPANDJE_55 